jgi:uncharacterized membrane protein YfcA
MGAIAGVMAGLLGIGGGALIVPVLAIVFESQKMDADIIMQAALGTSLATIVFTALSSVLAHHRRSAVRWAIVRRITPGIVIGGLLGAAIADVLSSRTLQIMFVVFMFAIAVQFGFGILAATASRTLPGSVGISLAGTAIGAASSLFGVGGGSMSVPFMTWCSVPVRQAIATSAAIGLPIALSATAGYVVAGWNDPRLPPWSVGYVVLPAFIGIVVASTLAAPLGARLAHRLSEATLRRIFALFVAILGVRMLWALLL